ncbi:hypothetical protein UPYG_G00226260 [Umbra pygmaea]|uniref:Uncharacterized protein n=1 Tax=Umbra pygmaea TaxID=75934 RepID=A0ABD0WCJ7_UMBPY
MPPPGVCMSIMRARYKNDGVGSLDNPEKFNNQNFQELKQYCLNRSYRYIDDTFPPDNTSIGYQLLRPEYLGKVVWLRPAKIVQSPELVVSGLSRFDFEQGKVGNCWFLASIGALTFQKCILEQVVPLKQSFQDDYCGIFHFRFWRFGRWVDVVIDDKLPTINGRLMFVNSKTRNEFWPALLEKAYAKVCGSYADMNAGTTSEAMMDFTGGVHITFQTAVAPPNLWDILLRASKSQSLMGCGTPQGATPENTVAPNGLVRGHAYTVTGVIQVMSKGMPVNLIRLFNPWGQGEWNEDWSDNSSLWETVSADDWKKCLSIADDGEFWMSIEDFCKLFVNVTICCLDLNFLDGNSTSRWTASFYDGRWVAGITAGGCNNNTDSYWTNPQYRVKIQESDNSSSEYNILVSLMQKPNKRNRLLVNILHIGFSIFEVPTQFKGLRGKFPASFFNTHVPVACTKSFLNAREVMQMFKLKPGEYLIVPSTFKPNETASFIMSILSKTETNVYENSTEQDGEETTYGQTYRKYSTTPTSPTNPKTPKPTFTDNGQNVDDKKMFLQYSDEFEEVNAEQLQRTLNENLLKAFAKKTLSFSLESCQSMVSLMDTSMTGKLNSDEFLSLWRKITKYRDIFFDADLDHSGILSLSELRNAILAAGIRVGDEMLNVLALRYGGSSGNISLESFISLVLRMSTMANIFRHLNNGGVISLQEQEWMYISMYT